MTALIFNKSVMVTFKGRFKFLRIFTLVFALLLSSCSSMGIKDFFMGYSQQMEPSRNAIAKDNLNEAESLLPAQNKGHNAYSLYLLEKGRIEFLNNQAQVSKQTFTQADGVITEADNQAKLQISRGLQKTASLVSNDSAIPYEVSYYEKGMLHTYQALNYLYQKNIEGALVEVRRANLVQNEALAVYEDEIFTAKEDMGNAGVDFDKAMGSYPSMSEVIGEVKNGFQNAYTFYLSGVLYEGSGELNDAYIDYKKALEIYPNNKYLQQDVLRLATTLGMQDDLTRFTARFGAYTPSQNSNTGEVVIIYEEGLVSAKEAVSLNLPIFTSGDDVRFFSFSLPVYKNHQSVTTPLLVSYEDQVYSSQNIVKIQALAAKQLTDQLPALITRQALRLVAKEQVRKQANKNAGDFGNIIASLYNVVSEKADTRSWSTLPDHVDILRMPLSEGAHKLKMNVANKQLILNINVTANRITLVHVTSVGQHTDYQTVNF